MRDYRNLLIACDHSQEAALAKHGHYRERALEAGGCKQTITSLKYSANDLLTLRERVYHRSKLNRLPSNVTETIKLLRVHKRRKRGKRNSQKQETGRTDLLSLEKSDGKLPRPARSRNGKPTHIPVRISDQRDLRVSNNVSRTAKKSVNFGNLIYAKTSKITNNKLRISCVNVRSIKNKLDDFADHVLSQDLDICVISETWLKSSDDVTLANIAPINYSIRSSPQENRPGGGLAILFKKNIDVIKILKIPKTSFEVTEWHLSYQQKTTVVIGIYRPPYSKQNPVTPSSFIDEFADYLEEVAVLRGHLLIMGDFNIHVDIASDPFSSRFLDLLDTMGLENNVNVPTHATGHTLDLIITRRSDDLKVHDIEATYYISDHSFICGFTCLEKPDINYSTITYRKLKCIDMASFKEDLQQSDFCVNPSEDLDNLVQQYHSNISEVLDAHAPEITKTFKVLSNSPWFTKELRDLKVQRRKLEYKWRASGLEDDHVAFKLARNKFVSEINLRKSAYYNNEVNKCSGDQKKLYNLVNKLTKGPQETPLPDHQSKQELADEFGEFFKNKVDKIRISIDNVMAAEGISSQTCYENCDNPSSSKMNCFDPLTPKEVSSTIMKCSSKYCRLDPAPTYIIKDCIDILLPSLTKIVNRSLANGKFPSCWKSSSVVPLLKKLDLDRTLKNYRPVSNLKFVSKVVESAAIQQYRDYLNENYQMPSRNAAYRKHNSTETILTRVHSDILCNMDDQKVTIMALLDLSAAFDTVDYAILNKIFQHKFNITNSVADWFNSYLTGRHQSIVIDGVTSREYKLSCGVPQGSCAGPVVFLSYISSLYNVIDRFEVNVGGYADDNQLYTAFKPSSDGKAEEGAIREINQCIGAVREWMLQHKLKINDGKTEIIVIGGAKQLHKVKDCVVTVGDSIIQSVKKVRNLGVIFDETLSMKDHINKVCQIGFHQIYRLKQIRNYFDRDSIENLVHSFVTCHIDYGNALMFGLPDITIAKLQRLQNAAARLIVQQSKYDTHSITSILKDLHWLPVKFRIKYKICLLVYKCLNGYGLDYLRELLAFPPRVRTLRSSSDQLLLHVPRMKTETYGKRSFKYAAPTTWNEVPSDIRNIDSIETFKKRLKTHYFILAFT